jgi:hypothetical protein
MKLAQFLRCHWIGGVSKVEIDKNNILKINGIGVSISTSETLPSSG